MIEDALKEELASLQQDDLYRCLKTLTQRDATHATLDDKEILLFCGNDYLIHWDIRIDFVFSYHWNMLFISFIRIEK